MVWINGIYWCETAKGRGASPGGIDIRLRISSPGSTAIPPCWSSSRFQGMATKYLQGYLDLCRFLKQTKYRKDERNVIIFMLSFAAASKSRFGIKNLYDYK